MCDCILDPFPLFSYRPMPIVTSSPVVYHRSYYNPLRVYPIHVRNDHRGLFSRIAHNWHTPPIRTAPISRHVVPNQGRVRAVPVNCRPAAVYGHGSRHVMPAGARVLPRFR